MDAVQKSFIKIQEKEKREKEEKKVLEKSNNNKGGGYLDEMDLPPCVSDEEGEYGYEDEEEEVELLIDTQRVTAESPIEAKTEKEQGGLAGDGNIDKVLEKRSIEY